jgi:hypothetical protein
LTVRQLIGRPGCGGGHRTFAGTPEQVANALQHWFEHGAADGFNVMPPVFPSGLERFVDHVAPLLQKRGLFRTESEGTTLRDHYGLSRPENVNLSRTHAGQHAYSLFCGALEEQERIAVERLQAPGGEVSDPRDAAG